MRETAQAGAPARAGRWLLLIGCSGLLLLVLGLLIGGAGGAAPASLQALKSAEPDRAHPGDGLAYTVLVTNSGGSLAETFWMTDALPIEVDYAGAIGATAGAWGVSGDVITWTGSLSPGEAAAITYTVRLSSALAPGAVVTNTALVTGGGELLEAPAEVTLIPFSVRLPLIFRGYPPVPVLFEIPPPDAGGVYTVSWSAVEIPFDHYVLQEAQDEGFEVVSGEWVTTEASVRLDKGSLEDLFFYRVRADRADGWGEGQWSNVEWLSTYYFYDGFADPASGWEISDDAVDRLEYLGGEYRVYTKQVGFVSRPVSPAAPCKDYSVGVRARWSSQPTWALYGLLFGANQDVSQYYLFLIRTETQEYYLFRRRADGGFASIASGTSGAIRRGTASNNLQVIRVGTSISPVVNGVTLGPWSDGNIVGLTRAGLANMLVSGTSDARFDDFFIAGCAGTAAAQGAGFAPPAGPTDHSDFFSPDKIW